jgi:predicted regulator of Ras-like GTPase activity (Roadblock/LC7/MglB family)
MDEASSRDLNWMLDDLVTRTAGSRHAIVLSTDGLCVGSSRDLSRDDGEHLSAMASAFQSLARGFGRHFDGGQVRQTIVELDKLFLVVAAAGNGACLAVVAAEDADIGMIAYEMFLMVQKVGKFLVSNPRVPDST